MTKRREFPASMRVEIVKRARRGGGDRQAAPRTA